MRISDWSSDVCSSDLGDHASDADDVFFPRTQVALKIAVMLFAVGRGHEHRYILAHHFFLDISEQPFGGGAERQYRAVIVDHHHGVRHGRQYRADMSFALRLSPLGRPFLGYVPNDLDIAEQPAAIVIKRRDVDRTHPRLNSSH